MAKRRQRKKGKPRGTKGRNPTGLRPGERLSDYPRLTVRVPAETVERLQELAKYQGVPQWRALMNVIETSAAEALGAPPEVGSMPNADTATDQAHRFFSSAIQYYVAGRFAVFAGLDPVAGNVLHTAIEMAIKGYLSRKLSAAELKTKYMHSLNPLWRDFKASVADPSLRQFDRTVSELDQFKAIRYPDRVIKHGMLAKIGSHRRADEPGVRTILPGPVPRYTLYLPEIDALFEAIVKASGNHQFFAGEILKTDAKEYLRRDNANCFIADVG